jgi:hypothetical protein
VYSYLFTKKEFNMTTETTQGTGPGAAQSSRGPDGGNRLNPGYIPATAPQVVAAGHLYTVGSEGNGNWQQRVTFDVPFSGDPHNYVVMVCQDDYGNEDGRNDYPPHVEKLDANGNNEDDGYEGGFGAFILHTGDNSERRFMWTVIKIGNTPSYSIPD